MLAKRIIPCLDVDNGRVVKGINFVNLIDAGDPVEQAKRYDAEGADELVFLDITASSDNRRTVVDMVRAVADNVFIPFTVGGGIRSVEEIRAILLAGADKVSLNTAAIKNPNLVREGAERFGSQCLVVAIDARRRISSDNGAYFPPSVIEAPDWARDRRNSSDNGECSTGGYFANGECVTGCWQGSEQLSRWEVFINGGRTPTGLDAIEWARKVEQLGAGEILLTSMDRDGTQDGYDIELTRAVAEAVNIPVIASGGVGTIEHLYEGLTEGKASAVLAASIFHFGKYSITQVKEYLRQKGLVIR